MARRKTINDIIGQVAIEVGIPKAQDVFASADPSMAQMAALANSVGMELLQSEEWQALRREHQIVTQAGDTGKYPLPADFGYMIDQTAWNRTDNLPIGGPLSAQYWAWLKGRDLVSYTIYAQFRRTEGEFWVFPQPPPEGLDLSYEYISRNWVETSTGSKEYQDFVDNAGNLVLFEPYLFERLLKVRFLGARGFDTTEAVDQYNRAMMSWSGKDKGAPVLNTARTGLGVPYLDAEFNTPDTGYGP